MTDEERQNLIADLRGFEWTSSGEPIQTFRDAANELERLAAENDWLRTALRAAQTASNAPAADRSGPADYVPPGGAGNGA